MNEADFGVPEKDQRNEDPVTTSTLSKSPSPLPKPDAWPQTSRKQSPTPNQPRETPALADQPAGSESLNPTETRPAPLPTTSKDTERLGRVRKKSEEGKHRIRLPGKRSNKEAAIPVGIAVAWQRQVTATTTGPPSVPTTTITPALSSPTMQSGSPSRSKRSPKARTGSSASASPTPDRHLTRPLDLQRDSSTPRSPNRNSSNARLPMNSPNLAMARNSMPVSTSSNELSARPSSTVTAAASSTHSGNTTGYPYDYSNGYGLSSRGSPYTNWQSQLQLMPQLTQGYSAAAAAAYLQQHQQLSLQTQMQLHLSNSAYAYNLSNAMYSGYSAESIMQYEQFLRQQQVQEQLEAHRRLVEYDLHQRASPSIQSLGSPRISIPSPSPGGTTTASSVFSQHSQHWASDLYHHHHMTLTSSTATLSPRSLASSTPSPLTIHDSHTYRKCVTPNPIPTKHFYRPGRDDRLSSPISLVKHDRYSSLSTLAEDASESPGPEDLTETKKHHDFTRPESLIEKRDNETVCLLDEEEERKKREKEEKKAERKAVKMEGRRRSAGSKRKIDCDGTVTRVPEEVKSKDTCKIDRKPLSGDALESHPKYFRPLEVSREPIYANSNNNYASSTPLVGKNFVQPSDFNHGTSVPLPGLRPVSTGNTGNTNVAPVYEDVSPPHAHCDSDTLVKVETTSAVHELSKLNPLPPCGGTSPSGLGYSFPKIVISSQENHLNLLATVAQEIGPYISMNTSHQPRRFESYNNMIQVQPSSETATSSTFAEVVDTSKIKTEPEPKKETEAANDLPALKPKSPQPFQLKIPQVLPRPSLKDMSPKKSRTESEKKPKVPKPKKEPKPKDPTKPKPNRPKNLEAKRPSVDSKPKTKLSIKKNENGNVAYSAPAPVPVQLVAPHPEEVSKSLCIYDFDFEDPKPLLEPFSNNRQHLTSSPLKHALPLLEKPKPKRLVPKIKNSFGLNDLNAQNSTAAAKDKEKKTSHGHGHGSKPFPALNREGVKKPRPISTVKPMQDTSFVVTSTAGSQPAPTNGISPAVHESTALSFFGPLLPAPTPTVAASTPPLPVNKPSTLPALSSTHFLNINTDSNASSNDGSVSSTSWITNPAYAVTAVKFELDTDSLNSDSPDEKPSPKRPKRKSGKPSKLSIEGSKEPDKVQSGNTSILDIKSQLSSFVHYSSPRKSSQYHQNHIRPCLKAEPVVRPISEADLSPCDSLDLDIQSPSLPESRTSETNKPLQGSSEAKSGAERLKIRKPSIDMNIFSRKAKTAEQTNSGEKLSKEKETAQEEAWNDNVVIAGVEEMIDEMRILTEIQGLFYTGKLNALHPPDVYGVTLDNERGAPPHIIFSAEEVLEKCIREAKPWKSEQLPHGLRICAYWSPMYSGLYPGKVSTDYDTFSDLVPVEFDDGDTGVIKIEEIRLLAPNHPVREYDPNPLLTLEKKHRKRRHSSAAGSQPGCTGDHEDADCGEAYCAKIAKLQEDSEEEDYALTNKYKYWAWHGLGSKVPKTKKNRHKEFFNGIQRGDEVISVGDSAIFISHERNERPFLGKVEKFWEKKGHKVVNVRWFYHPEEVKVKSGKRLQGLKYPGALFESSHIDENDVQTIAKKCEVLPFEEYKEKYDATFKTKTSKSGHKKSRMKGIYYLAGYYDPYTFKLKMKDLK